MNILYLGDIMGRPGRGLLKRWLADIQKEHAIDFTIAQAENLSGGKGMRTEHIRDLQAAGVDFFTGGNWSWAQADIYPLLDNPAEPIIRPANYPAEVPGRGHMVIDTAFGKVLIICVLGQIVGANQPQVANPLKTVDDILSTTEHHKLAARIVNFHGDYSSEKLVIGQYLDGRVTAVIGDHWHIPTADAGILPGGTAHITDVGMVGSLDSSLGVKTDIIVARWLSQLASRNELETGGRGRLCAVVIQTDPKTGLAKSINQIIKTDLL